MLTLPELQRGFRDSMLGGPEMAPQTPQRSERPGTAGALLDTARGCGADPERQPPQRSEALRRSRGAPRPRDSFTAEIVGDGIAPDARLAVYRHHVLATLTDALKTTYPVVCRLVDERFFGYMADRYIRAHPPAGPCLFEFGDSLPAFIAAFGPANDLAYLPDVARLEWAMNLALHAEDTPPIESVELSAVPPALVPSLVLRLDPSITLLASPWPIDRIWRANQPGADPAVDLAAGAARLEVRRVGDDVSFRTLDPAPHAFRAAIAGGQALAGAADTALAVGPAFDLAGALHALLEDGAIVGMSFDGVPKESPR